MAVTIPALFMLRAAKRALEQLFLLLKEAKAIWWHITTGGILQSTLQKPINSQGQLIPGMLQEPSSKMRTLLI